MRCDEALNLIWAWIDEEFSAEEEQQLDAHLAGCPACRRQKAECVNYDRELRDAWAVDSEAVDALKQRVKETILGTQPPKVSLLIVEDEPLVRQFLARCLASEFAVATADGAGGARDRFARQPTDMILSDHEMPGENGVQLLEWVKERYPDTIRLLMTGGADRDSAIDAINRGKIYHYLAKPWNAEEWLPVLRNAADKFILMRKQEELFAQLRQLTLDLEERVLERTRAYRRPTGNCGKRTRRSPSSR